MAIRAFPLVAVPPDLNFSSSFQNPSEKQFRAIHTAMRSLAQRQEEVCEALYRFLCSQFRGKFLEIQGPSDQKPRVKALNLLVDGQLCIEAIAYQIVRNSLRKQFNSIQADLQSDPCSLSEFRKQRLCSVYALFLTQTRAIQDELHHAFVRPTLRRFEASFESPFVYSERQVKSTARIGQCSFSSIYSRLTVVTDFEEEEEPSDLDISPPSSDEDDELPLGAWDVTPIASDDEYDDEPNSPDEAPVSMLTRREVEFPPIVISQQGPFPSILPPLVPVVPKSAVTRLMMRRPPIFDLASSQPSAHTLLSSDLEERPSDAGLDFNAEAPTYLPESSARSPSPVPDEDSPKSDEEDMEPRKMAHTPSKPRAFDFKIPRTFQSIVDEASEKELEKAASISPVQPLSGASVEQSAPPLSSQALVLARPVAKRATSKTGDV